MGEHERKIIQWATIVQIEINSIEHAMRNPPTQTQALKLVTVALADAKFLVELILGEAREKNKSICGN